MHSAHFCTLVSIMRSGFILGVLATSSMSAQQNRSTSPSLAGLLDFPAILAGGNPELAPETLNVYRRPSTASPRITALDQRGIRKGEGYECEWTRDIETTEVPPGACIYTESGYEVPALAVFEERPGWYRIALDPRLETFGWVQSKHDYHPLLKLIGSEEQSTYLTEDWDRRLFGAPGQQPRTVALPNPRSDSPEAQSYRTIGHSYLAGQLWLKVEILDDVCGEHDPRVLHTGWVPVRSASGKLWVWFFSRGC